MLYAAPAWATCMNVARTRKKLEAVNRKTAIRICSAYRTISDEAVTVIANCPPIDLLVTERTETYRGIDKRIARGNLLNNWQLRWTNSPNLLWTKRLIQDILPWINRKHGEVDFCITQVLSGHGCFRSYLKRFRLTADPNCPHCDIVDDAEHTVFYCLRWTTEREACSQVIETDLTVKILYLPCWDQKKNGMSSLTWLEKY